MLYFSSRGRNFFKGPMNMVNLLIEAVIGCIILILWVIAIILGIPGRVWDKIVAWLFKTEKSQVV